MVSPMIRYAMSCDKNHSFDSWFASGAAFDKLLGAGLVECSICGSAKVSKSLMAPAVRHGTQETPPSTPLSGPGTVAELALAEMRRRIEAESEYVGLAFAAEARAIHDGDAPERAIYGEARADEARALIADGVPVAALPFMPRRRSN